MVVAAPSAEMQSRTAVDPLLEVRDLKTYFFTRRGVAKVLDGLSFHVGKGEIVGLVGESGSGKSVTGFSIVRLLKNPGRIVGGEVVFEGRDLAKLSEDEIQEIRGKQVSMIFQNPRSSLNPVISVGEQIAQVLRYRRGLKKDRAWQTAIDLLRTVHIPEPERRMKAFPHQLSGGMAQRVMIAMAISCSPKLLIADEPTTGLDVTIEYQIIQLLKEMRDLTGTSVIVITHDLNMAAEVCDRIMVMYAGRIVEEAPVRDFFTTPRHPYTVGLLASRPSLAVDADIPTIPGNVPDLIDRPSGCPFHPRCRWATDVCRDQDPAFREIAPHHFAACHHVEDVARDVVAAR
ncbi:MAG TPA: ABC transporter ATP-binding protein [Thermomicrobiales bacterium]